MKDDKFHLHTFIKNCKEFLPKYLRSLYNSNLSKIEINLNKRLIITFLKEYFKHHIKNSIVFLLM